LVSPLPSPINVVAVTDPEKLIFPFFTAILSVGVSMKNFPSALLPLQPNFVTRSAPVVSKNSIADFDCADTLQTTAVSSITVNIERIAILQNCY
jgi:hypothetical protein